ncbi:GAS2-like protein 2 [Pyxicephalus adspersus]|uniref:GAS2-like protein 2 n=1 Tax=Pyxicephalus adspersus TaxID=30357 RepID=UPI003B5B342C
MSSYQGGVVRSIRPFKSSEQYLYAMKEDLAEWLKDIYNLEIHVDNFFEVLENGSIICYHANNVTDAARTFALEYPDLAKKLRLPKTGVTFNAMAQPGTFLARDNVSNFIQWCRKEMEIKEVLMFETEDLVLRKNEKNFILCLLELARRASRFGMSAPMLIQMEEQIEEEIREELELPPVEIPLPKPQSQKKLCDFKNLDQMVQHLVSRCTCPVQFSMIKVSEGKYKVGESNTLIFVRILRNHVMVRVGGGWDTLEHYLDKHDPWRCTSLSHKQVSVSASNRKPAYPVHEITARLTPRADNSNKTQTTLIVNRAQSPLPPVDWKSYTSGRAHISSSSAETVEKTAGFRTPNVYNDLKRSSVFRTHERPLTPSRRHLFSEDGHNSQQFLYQQPSHVNHHMSTSSTGSQFTGSEDDNSYCSDVFYENNRGRQRMKSPAPGLKEKTMKDTYHSQIYNTTVRAQSAVEKDSTQDLRPKTPSRILRPPSPSKYFLHNQQNKISECQPQVSTDNTARPSSPMKQIARPSSPMKQIARPSSPIKQTATRSISPSKQLFTRSSSPTKQLNTQSSSPPKQIYTRSISPTKQVNQPIKQDVNGAKTMPIYNRPCTPSRNYQSESEFRDKSKSVGCDFNMSHNKLMATKSVPTHNDQSKPIRIGRSTPTVQINKNGLTQDKDPTYSMKIQKRQTSALEASIMSDNIEQNYRYTPKPIGPDQEQELYQSLEDEIQSNIKALEEDSDDEENKSNTFTPSIASDVAVRDFSMKRTPVSSGSLTRNGLKTPDGEAEIPRSGVYINTKWEAGGGSFDDVITELSQGQVKLNRVDVENWISKISPKAVVTVETGLPAQHSVSQEKSKPAFSEQKTDTTKLLSVENKEKKVKQLPSQRARQQAMEAKKKNSESAPDKLGSPSKSHKVETTPELSKLPQSSKPKRSLKKPERVPSIYKLKLRPKIRPRRDNRPEKKPSKIPTPVSYLQAKKKSKHPQNSSVNTSSTRSWSETHSTVISTGDLDTDEAVSELSLSLEASGSQLNQTFDENNGCRSEEEETWI